MSHRVIFLVALFAITAPILIQPFNQEDDTDQLSLISEGAHSRERRSRRFYIVRCCGRKSCLGPSKRRGRPGFVTPPRGNTNEPPDYPIDIPIGDNSTPPIACAQINFQSLAGCCQLHPSIFDYMDPDIRTCTNRTTSMADFPYFKSVLTDYMLNQAVTMKNKLDLRRIPNAVKFYDCFFRERVWIGLAEKGEIFNPAMIDEWIDNVDPSWDDLLSDALTNCTKVIKSLVPYPFMQLPMKDDASTKQVYQTYPILITQCMRKVMLSYCPSPNRPSLTPQCNDMRSKFRVCDPFQQTSNPSDYEDDGEESTDYTDEEGPPRGNTPPSGDGGDTNYPDENTGGNDYNDGGDGGGDGADY